MRCGGEHFALPLSASVRTLGMPINIPSLQNSLELLAALQKIGISVPERTDGRTQITLKLGRRRGYLPPWRRLPAYRSLFLSFIVTARTFSLNAMAPKLALR